MTQEKKTIDLKEDDVLKRTARKFAQKVKIVNEEDILQELYLWFFEDTTYKEKIQVWRATIPNHLSYIQTDAKGIAYDFCKKETKELYGGKIADEHFYTEKRIEAGLPHIWNINFATVVQEHPQTGNPMTTNQKHRLNPQTLGLAHAIAMDIRNAFNSLNKKEQELIELYFHQGYQQKEIGRLYGISEDAVRQRIHRVIEKMHIKLSGRTSHWDSEQIGRNNRDTDY